jgi:hypothetical protein
LQPIRSQGATMGPRLFHGSPSASHASAGAVHRISGAHSVIASPHRRPLRVRRGQFLPDRRFNVLTTFQTITAKAADRQLKPLTSLSFRQPRTGLLACWAAAQETASRVADNMYVARDGLLWRCRPPVEDVEFTSFSPTAHGFVCLFFMYSRYGCESFFEKFRPGLRLGSFNRISCCSGA